MSHISLFEAQARAEEEIRARQSIGGIAISGTQQTQNADIGGAPRLGGTTASATPLCNNKNNEISVWDFYAGGGKTPKTRFLSRFQPYSRRISFQPVDIRIDLEDEEHKEEIEQLSNHHWKVHRVSPLINFCYDKHRLDLWAKSLEDDFHRARAFLPDLQDYQKISATISKAPGLRGSENDNEAVKVEVFTRKGKTKLVTAILLSVDSPEKLELEGLNDVVFLPVMLGSGAEPLLSVLRSNLQKSFDCTVGSVFFSQHEMKWAMALWVNLNDQIFSQDPADKEVELNNPIIHQRSVRVNYKMTHGIDNLEIKMQQSQLLDLWNSIHDPSENNATVLEVEVFHSALTEHIRKSIGLNLETVDIAEVDLPVAKLKYNGRLFIETKRHVKSVLRYLTENCTLALESIRPTLGISTGDTLIV